MIDESTLRLFQEPQLSQTTEIKKIETEQFYLYIQEVIASESKYLL